MIAQLVFDLPIDGPFDYLVPENLVSQVSVGRRVKASFGPRVQIGFVVHVLAQSHIPKLKSLESLLDQGPVFNDADLVFARNFSGYYACSLGETLATMLRNKEGQQLSMQRDREPKCCVYRCPPDHYGTKVQEIMQGYRKAARAQEACFLILVPDGFRGESLRRQFKEPVPMGLRSTVFGADGRYDCVIMVDDEDPSYKQEQTPMYETRQVLLMRAKHYGFDVAFVGISPSVELMALVEDKKVQYVEALGASLPPVRLVDLSNYKFLPGLLSPPVRDALEASLKAGQKSFLVLNRKGSYRLTRCVDCGHILKCKDCDSALIYSRKEGKFLCRYCSYTAPAETGCPQCRKPSWRSQGIGVEQLQAELKKYFPQARIVAFERPVKSPAKERPLGDFDVLIATQALLRFQGRWQAGFAAFIDFDAELNRLDMRSAFNAFRLVEHVRSMVGQVVFIQTRQEGHYVLQALAKGGEAKFYDEELKLRRELGFVPFKHWIKMSWRGKLEKPTREAAEQVYNILNQSGGGDWAITPPLADMVSRKRAQFRFNVMLQVDDVPRAVALVKARLAQIKRPARVIRTMEIDP